MIFIIFKEAGMEPLWGIRVLDFSRYAPGRYCSMFLADFGAEVITVEVARVDPSISIYDADDLGPRYLAFGRNKKSIALNLRVKEAREVIYRLIKTTDILIEGFRPGVMKRLGMDYETLREMNPRLIYCSMSGYGQDGPYRDRPGHDVNYLGIGGILDLTRCRDGSPTLIGTQIADLGGGTFQALSAILLALLARERTGKGQYIDVSLFDGVIAWHWITGARFLLRGEVDKSLFGDSAGYNIYETKDGKYITLGIREKWFWEKFCRLIGREDLIPYMDPPPEKKDEVISELTKVFKEKTRDEWEKLLWENDIPSGPVKSLGETFEDPHVLHRGMIIDMEHPVLGRIKLLGNPFKLKETPPKMKSPPPRYGEHTEEILRELGYTEEDIKRLRELKAIDLLPNYLQDYFPRPRSCVKVHKNNLLPCPELKPPIRYGNKKGGSYHRGSYMGMPVPLAPRPVMPVIPPPRNKLLHYIPEILYKTGLILYRGNTAR